jgi:signal peptidase
MAKIDKKIKKVKINKKGKRKINGIRIPHKLIIAVDIFEWVIFIALVALLIAVLLPVLPTQKQFQAYIVPTGSMEPTIHTGSLAFTSPVKTAEIKTGNIIAFVDPNNAKLTIIHRVAKITVLNKQVAFKTKGDNNNSQDIWTVPPPLVRGKFIFAIPYLGYISVNAKTPLGFGLMIVLPAILLMLLQIKRIKEGIEEEVVKRTDEALKNRLMMLVILFVGLGAFSLLQMNLTKVQYASALYTTRVTINNVGFTVKNFTPQPLLMSIPNAGPVLTLAESTDGNSLTFTITGVSDYNNLSYTLNYDTATVPQGVVGSDVVSGQTYTSSPIIFGTCSTGGTCVYNSGVKNVVLTVTLSGPGGSRVLTGSL